MNCLDQVASGDEGVDCVHVGVRAVSRLVNGTCARIRS